jgi:hypothetical protein
MDAITAKLQAIKTRISRAAAKSGRDAKDITLVAVSKTFGGTAIRAAYDAGQRAFGESYLQEALTKTAGLADLPLEWHFVGPIQSNKTRAIAETFDWIHSIDREKIATRLSAARPTARSALQVCIEINLGGEATKTGVRPEAAGALACAVARLPRLRLRGLMAVPPATADTVRQRHYFSELRRVAEDITANGIPLDTLSMGMSTDFEIAIAEGATLVRIGSAIFGTRDEEKIKESA